jgi:type VI secretion system protein ImpC
VINSDSGLEAEFKFEGDPGGEIDEVPFHILVLGDWSGDADRRSIDARKPIEIDRDNFDEVLAGLDTRLDLAQVDGSILNLEFSSLDDFHPDQIFKNLPMFGQLRDLRRRLLSSDEFNSAAREVRSWFDVDDVSHEQQNAEPQSAAEQPEKGSVLDAILSGAPVAEARRAATPDNLASLIKDLVRPHLVSVNEDERSALLAAVDAATSDLMRHILHDHRFQALEAAWRGLYFLVRRVETSSEMKIYILDITQSELTEDLSSVSDLSGSVLFKRVVQRTDTLGGDPWALVVANYAFMPAKGDIAALMRIAKISAIANVPFISHIRPEVLGVATLFENTDPKNWLLNTDSEAGKLWMLLRSIPEAEYLGLTIPRFIGRLPYGRETEPLETFQFEEFDDVSDHDKYLWSNSAFVAALLMAQSFSEFGWQMDHRFLQDVEGLPVHMYKSDGETVFQPAAEVLLTQNACELMMEHGLMPLVSYKNTDRAKLARFQSISDPVKGLRGRWH